MRFSDVAKKIDEVLDDDELRDVAVDLFDNGVPEEEIVVGMAIVADKALPLDKLGAKLGPQWAAAGALLEQIDGFVLKMVIRPIVRWSRDPETRKHWRESRRAARAAKRG